MYYDYNNLPKRCEHSHQPVRMGDYVVWASNYSWNREGFWDIKPDLFVALDSAWVKQLIPQAISFGVPELKTTYILPFAYLNWSDKERYHSQHELKRMVTILLDRIYTGQRIEIACYGGHGRTGTLLAILLGNIEHLPPKKAIKAIRERYCPDAIESLEQIRQIYLSLGYTKKEANHDWYVPPPPKVEPSAVDKATNTVVVKTADGKLEGISYEDWREQLRKRYGITPTDNRAWDYD